MKEIPVTIDAMGSQKKIATKIINSDADYILAVKGNQLQLLEHIQYDFRFPKTVGLNICEDMGHGRIETRACSVLKDFYFIEKDNQWKSLHSIIKIESTREFKNSDKPTERATRYGVSTFDVTNFISQNLYI